MKKSDMKGIAVVIEDENDESMKLEYFIKKSDIAATARAHQLYLEIQNTKYSDKTKNQLFVCANLSTVLCNKDRELLFPEPEGDGAVDDGYKTIYSDFEPQLFFLLMDAFNEANPVRMGLKAKKKKY